MPSRDDYRVLDYNVKGTGRNAEQRMKILEQVAKQVQPIMKRHSWTVAMLSELAPTSRRRLWGLNINRGAEVKLRLMEFDSTDKFLPYEAVVGTMLHELCHNDIGPHNAQFYKLLDEINLELDEFMAKGITGSGEGFDAPSAGRLGGRGFGAHNPSLTELRSKMLQAADARARASGFMPSGPLRLGGSALHLTPREAAAAAAERRARDDTGCACGLKGSTAFTEAEVLELESQPGSAPVSQQNSKQEPRALLRSRSEALNSSRTCRSDSIDSLESRERKAAKLPDYMNSDVGRQANSSLQEGVSMQNQEQEVIDLISDSEGEVELVE